MSKQKTPALFKSRPATKAELQEETVKAAEVPFNMQSIGGVRKAVDDLWSGEWSPSKVITVLRNAQAGTDTGELANLADTIIRREPNIRSYLNTRVLALAGLDLVCEPMSSKLRDKKIAADCLALLQGEVVSKAIPEMMYGGVWLNFSLHEAVWQFTPSDVLLNQLEYKRGSWIVFDKQDGKTPLLKPADMGANLEPLATGGKFMWHNPGLLPGLTLTSGLAYTAAFFYAIKNIALKDWLGFVELFGQPMRLGTIDKGSLADSDAAKQRRKMLRSALENLGADAWAMIPEGMKIEIVEAAGRQSSTDAYERICRYLDECLARLILGSNLTTGTSNTGSGGSRALGEVHDEVRGDILRADAKAMANTLRRCILTPYVQWKYGADAQVPMPAFQIEEHEDKAALSDALAKLIPLGWQVSQAEVSSKFGLRVPEEGETVFKAPVQTSAPSSTPSGQNMAPQPTEAT